MGRDAAPLIHCSSVVDTKVMDTLLPICGFLLRVVVSGPMTLCDTVRGVN